MFGTPLFRQQFPIFQHYPNLVYLDSAATTQKPQMVIDGITQFYQKENANIHRGIYDLAAQTTQKYEAVRQKVANFIGAKSTSEIVYTSGTTASINLVVNSFLLPRLKKGDEVRLKVRLCIFRTERVRPICNSQ
ncbi:MAG: aminotransferase class V-fold PLP-dependent enzyme, partial [Bacteroidota bacterium]